MRYTSLIVNEEAKDHDHHYNKMSNYGILVIK